MPTITGGALVESANLTRSWGISPASGQVIAVGDHSGLTGTDFVLNLGGTTFYAVVADDQVRTDFNSGSKTTIDLVDNRVKLTWEDVYCTFNNGETREDNPATPGVDRQRRYWHILPENWDTQTKTWTDDPLTAHQILDYLFNAPTVSIAWSRTYHAAQEKPVFAVDANKGSKLANVLQEITDEQGLVLTLVGSDTLVWTQKGEGTIPTVSGADRSEWRLGEAINANDTNVRIVGDRNRYQDMPVTLQVDWVAAYEAFWFEPDWLAEVAATFSLATATMSDRATLAAKARTVTVREYVTAKGDDTLSDYGIWGEVSRMEIPVWAYLNDVVFKAYRVPSDYTLNSVAVESLELVEGLMAAVEFDIPTGAFDYKSPRENFPDTKAYAIVQGQQLDLLDPRTQTVITAETLNDARTAWAANNKFNLDTKNKTLIFQSPVFVPGEGDAALFLFPNRSVSGITSTDPLYNIAVPNAGFTISHAVVRAALCFEAELYAKRYGSGHRKGPKYVRGLCAHTLMFDGSFVEEITYADGKTADQKSNAFALSLTAQQPTYASGSYKRHGAVGTALSGVIDRVSVNVNFSEFLVEEVTLTKERGPSNFEGERELERRQMSKDLFPGQKALREAAKEFALIAKLSKEIKRNPPAGYANLNDAMQRPVGAFDCSPTTFHSSDTWPAGQPVFVDPATGSPSSTGTLFLGVTTCDGGTGHAVPAATQGTVPTRVQGPVSIGDSIGLDNGTGQTAKKDGAKFFGTAAGAYAGTGIVTIPVRIGGGGGAAAAPDGFFQLKDASTTIDGVTTLKVGVTASDINGEEIAEQFFTVTESGKVWAHITSDSGYLETDWAIENGADVPDNDGYNGYVPIGYYTVSGTTLTVRNYRLGPVGYLNATDNEHVDW